MNRLVATVLLFVALTPLAAQEDRPPAPKENEKEKPPVFRKGDPEKQKKTESGIVWEVVAAGEGNPSTKDQGISFRFALFNKRGELIHHSGQLEGGRHGGAVAHIALGSHRLRFLEEMALLMKPGGRYRMEVPPELCFGDTAVGPNLPAGSATVWEVEVLKVTDIPKFRRPDAESATTTESGLIYEVVKAGEGKSPGPTDTVTVYYTGWLTDGTLFDSGHARGSTTTFPLNGVIPGWTEGLQLMKVGGTTLFEIPGDLAYAKRPRPGLPFDPKETLVFIVELVKIGK